MTAPVLIVIGASAGGIETLVRVAGDLPADLPAAIAVVVHIPINTTSLLPRILERSGPLPARHAAPDQELQPGHIYVAPPNYHVVVSQRRIQLWRGPMENGHRPAIDPLFRSAARAYGKRAIGVILSGALDDGTAGLRAIKAHGGLAVVQDPDEAFYADMPRNALENVAVDYTLPHSDIGPELVRLTTALLEVDPEGAESMAQAGDPYEDEIIQADKAALERGERSDEPTIFTCPNCGGAIWELTDGDNLRFRCHVGHAYSAESFLNGQSEVLEAALWTAVRTLEEKASLSRRLLERARRHGHKYAVQHFERQERETEQQAALVREALALGEVPLSEAAEEPDPARPRQLKTNPRPARGQAAPKKTKRSNGRRK